MKSCSWKGAYAPRVGTPNAPDGPDVLDGGDVVDVYLQAKRDGAAAKRFFKRLLRSHGGEPRKIVTDKLRSYGVAHRGLIPEAIHVDERISTCTGVSYDLRKKN